MPFNMNKLRDLIQNEDVLASLDMLDLDEQLIDDKLETLLKRTSLEHSHFKTILVFLKYKYMICLQEETDCENDIYVNFALKQLIESSLENVNILLDILSVSLLLSTERLQNVAEHLIQQLMIVDDVQSTTSEISSTRPFKIIDNVLELCIRNKVSVRSTFLHDELQKLIITEESVISTQFFTKTIPLIMSCCQDYSALNQIWDRILIRVNQPNHNDYVILCTLSEFYLPLKTDPTFTQVQSTIIENYEFWKLLCDGFIHEEYSVRKCSLYLARRAIHCAGNREITSSLSLAQARDNIPLFKWNKEEKESLECSWLALFTLLETLEEKQSHLVLPALKLFDQISTLHNSWYNCALVRAFSHGANGVIQQAIEIALRNSNDNSTADSFPYKPLIIALNNTFLYEHIHDYHMNQLIHLLTTFLGHSLNARHLITSLSSVNLSPIPKFYISYALMLIPKSAYKFCIKNVVEGFFYSNSPILNNAMIQCATECCFLNFIYDNNIGIPKAESLLEIISSLSTKKLLIRGNMFWSKTVDFLKKCNDTDKELYQSISTLMDRNELQKISDFKSLATLFVIYCDSDHTNLSVFIEFLRVLLKCLKDSQNREYSLTTEFDSYFLLIVNAIEVMEPTGFIQDTLGNALMLEVIADNADVLINYLTNRLLSDLSIDKLDIINQYISGLDVFMNKTLTKGMKTSAESLFQKAVSILKSPGNNTMQKYFSVKILSIAATETHSGSLDQIFKIEILSNYYRLVKNITISIIDEPEHSKGKLLSELNQAKLQIYVQHYSCKDHWAPECVTTLHREVMDWLETGGHGCLYLIIKLAHILLRFSLTFERVDEIKIAIDRIWRECFDLRKNDQFKMCFKSFIKMVYQKELLASKLMHSTLLEYGEKVFQLGDQTPFVVLELMENMNRETDNLIHKKCYFLPLLSQALTSGMVLRKDQRIEVQCCEFIISQNKVFLIPREVKYIVNPVPYIRSAALHILKNQNTHAHESIICNLRENLNSINKPANRYHGNSLQHRFLLRTLQTLLFSFKVEKNGDYIKGNLQWCVQRLITQPHHVSSRIMLEWYIALYYIRNNVPLNSATVTEFQLSEIPQLSYFMIIFHILKHRITSSLHKTDGFNSEMYEDFNFAMQTYLPNTMGPLFNIRLHAQYLMLKLNEMIRNDPICDKYQMMCETIRHTFHLSAEEKNLQKIKDDFYINDFDIINGLNVNNIFYNVLRMTGVAQDEWVFGTASNEIEMEGEYSSSNLIFENIGCDSATVVEISSTVAINIQKKFVPWKNVLAELGITSEQVTGNKSDSKLMVVASLIDRLPNLGGLARTCEVFGVQEYAIDSLRHLQDKQFQTLSVSSERWLNIIEVKPGAALKNHLIEMKKKGYIIVGAEQTSSSVSLNGFAFPKNTLLLLGHEKEGIPCNLLNLLDICVEIPQYGLVRSLNVHVTASIFIWEYTRQHSK